MSIEGKHAYRFTYLKSEQWQNVRIEALAREKGKCQICAEESISNDAHHVWYPESIWDTRAENLVIVCRPCHDFLHSMMPECKTNDEAEGRQLWLKFSNAISVWRSAKWTAMQTAQSPFANANQLRRRLEEVSKENEELRKGHYVPPKNKDVMTKFIDRLKQTIQEFESRVIK